MSIILNAVSSNISRKSVLLRGAENAHSKASGGNLSSESVLPAMRAVFAALQSSEQGKYVDIPENR